MTPFDFVNQINSKKQDLIRNSDNPDLAEKVYNPFLINKAFSYHIDAILYANEMNFYNNLDNKLQNDYYLNTLRASKRFSKWHKREQDATVECLMEYYKINYSKAEQISKVLTDEQVDHIKKKIIKGGNNDLRPKQASRG